MSTSYIAIFPKNPLLSNPKKIEVILKLKEIGFIHEIDFKWVNPENGIEESIHEQFAKGLNGEEKIFLKRT